MLKLNFHQLSPLGRVGLVVTKSVCFCVVPTLSPSHAIFLGLSLALWSHDQFEASHWSTPLRPWLGKNRHFSSTCKLFSFFLAKLNFLKDYFTTTLYLLDFIGFGSTFGLFHYAKLPSYKRVRWGRLARRSHMPNLFCIKLGVGLRDLVHCIVLHCSAVYCSAV